MELHTYLPSLDSFKHQLKSHLMSQLYPIRPPGDCPHLWFKHAWLCACYKFAYYYYYYYHPHRRRLCFCRRRYIYSYVGIYVCEQFPGASSSPIVTKLGQLSTCRPTLAAAVHGHSSTCHWQPCDRDGFRNRVTLSFHLLTTGSMHAERLP